MTDMTGRIGIAALMCVAFAVASCGDSTAPEDVGPISLKIVGGNEQTAVVGTELPEPLMVKATNHRGRPLRHYLVNFVVTKGDGSVFAGAAMTNWRGVALDYWTMGPEPGENVVEVRAVNSWTGEKQVFGRFTATAVPVPVSSVEVTPEAADLQLIANPTVQLTVVLTDGDANVLEGREVEWSSNDETVAMVDGNGLVTAVGEGTAVITASSGGESDYATISVAGAPVAQVLVEPATLELEPGDTQELTVTLKDANGDVLTGREVSFSSNDEGVATVSDDGIVTAQGAGNAMITVGSEGVETTATVSVAAAVIAKDQYEDNNSQATPTDLSAWFGVIADDALLEIQANFHDPSSDKSDWYLLKVTEDNLNPGGCGGSIWEPFTFTAILTGIPEGSNYDLAAVYWKFENGPFVAWGSAQAAGNADEVFSKAITGNCQQPSDFEFLVRVSHVSGPAAEGPYTLSMILATP